jgi:hypothetical protein
MHLKLIENAWRRLRRDNHHGVVIIVVVAIIIMPRAAARLIIISSGTYAYVLTTASTAAHCHNCWITNVIHECRVPELRRSAPTSCHHGMHTQWHHTPNREVRRVKQPLTAGSSACSRRPTGAATTKIAELGLS